MTASCELLRLLRLLQLDLGLTPTRSQSLNYLAIHSTRLKLHARLGQRGD